MHDQPTPPEPQSPRQYRWPWVVLAVFLFGIALAVLWMNKEITRTRRNRDFNVPGSSSNRVPTSIPARSPASAPL